MCVCAGNPFVKSWVNYLFFVHAFRMRSVQTLRKRHKICLKFMRSRCVPCKPSAKRINNHSAGMRSYAFRATLPQICKTAMRSYEFRLRSVYASGPLAIGPLVFKWGVIGHTHAFRMRSRAGSAGADVLGY